MIDVADVSETVTAYLTRFPEDRRRLGLLLKALDERVDVTSRNSSHGHLTCSAVVIDPQRRVLHIRHNVLGTWLQPGGHLEPSDSSLRGAALRELNEETGIPEGDVNPLGDDVPIDIDVHMIPANPANQELEHPHFDLRFAFTAARVPTVTLQPEEVSAFHWLPEDEIEAHLRRRLPVLP